MPRRREARMLGHRRGTAQSSARLRAVQCKVTSANGLTGSREPLSTLYRLLILGRVLDAGLPGKSRLPKEGSQTMRGAPLALVRLSSLSAAATLFVAACGGGAAQPTAAPAAPATTAPAKPAAAPSVAAAASPSAAASPAPKPAASPAASPPAAPPSPRAPAASTPLCTTTI